MHINSKFTALILLLFCAQSVKATTRKVFFIGNSYTYTNSMPDMFRDFAAASGDTLIYSMSAPGGYTFQQHTTYAPTISGLYSQQWDVVVLQEQSQLPSFSPAQVATQVYPYAHYLDSLIGDNDSCTETMFMMTWGRRNGDAMNCPTYPVVCTYEGMQSRLRDSYMEMAADNHASIAPMGAAWHIVIDSFPSIDLYQADSSHPSMSGSYLQACVFYASIFHRPALGCSYTGGLPATTVATLQRIADKVVFDSLDQWQQHGHYPYAAYSHSYSPPGTISFTNHSERATGYYWVFGEGGTDIAASPSYVYTSAGVYTVSLTVTNDCFSFTRKDTIHVGGSIGVDRLENLNDLVRVHHMSSGHTVLRMADGGDVSQIQISDMAGRLVKTDRFVSGQVDCFLPSGMYIYRVISERTGEKQNGRFVMY